MLLDNVRSISYSTHTADNSSTAAQITPPFTPRIQHVALLLFLISHRVYIVTWNVGSAVPPDDITSLFGPNVSDGSVDMFVIG